MASGYNESGCPIFAATDVRVQDGQLAVRWGDPGVIVEAPSGTDVVVQYPWRNGPAENLQTSVDRAEVLSEPLLVEGKPLCEGQWVRLKRTIRFRSTRLIQEGSPAVVLDMRRDDESSDGDVVIHVAQMRGQKAFDFSVRRSEIEPFTPMPAGLQPSPGTLHGGFRAGDLVYASQDIIAAGQDKSSLVVCRGDVGYVFGLGLALESRENGELAVRFEARLDSLKPSWCDVKCDMITRDPPLCKGHEVRLKTTIQFPDGVQVDAGSVGLLVEAAVPEGRDIVEIQAGQTVRAFQAQPHTLELARQSERLSTAMLEKGVLERRLLQLERLAQRNDENGWSLRNVSMLEQNLWASYGWVSGAGISFVASPGRSERRSALIDDQRCILLSRVNRHGLDGTLQNESALAFNHEALINDRGRVGPYKSAIERVAARKRALDIGTGPACLLARLCLRAGAQCAEAVENTERSVRIATEILQAETSASSGSGCELSGRLNIVPDWASLRVSEVSIYENRGGPNTVAKIVGEHGDAQQLRLFHGMSSDVSLALQGNYSLLVHEILGDMAGSEGAAAVVADVRQRGLLAEGCCCVPQCSSTMLAPTSKLKLSTMEVLVHRWGHSGRAEIEPCKRYSVRNFRTEALLAKPQALEVLDFADAAGPELIQRRNLEFQTERDGEFDGIHMHLLVDLDGIDKIDALEQHANQTDDIRCTWNTIYIRLLEQPMHLAAGSRILCRCCASLEEALAKYSIEVFVGDSEKRVALFEWQGG